MGSTAVLRTARARLLKNSLFNSCAWGATLIINLVAIPIIVRYLGVEGYGIYALLTGLFGYFGLLDFGLTDGVIKYVAHYLQLRDYDSLKRSINAALLVQFFVGGIGVLALWAFDSQIVHLLRIPASLFRAASIGLCVSAAGFFFKMLLNTYNATLKGLQRFDVLAKTTVGFSIATTITVVVVLFAGGRLLAVVIATALLICANLAVVIGLVRHYVPGYRLSLVVARGDFHALLGFGAYVFISRIASVLNSYFLQVIIAVILGPAAVTYFVVPMKLTSAMEGGFYSLTAVIFPYISALTAQGNTESMQRLYSQASKNIVALSTPVFLFVIVFSRQILAVWLGREFSVKSWPVLTCLCCATLLAVWTMVPANTTYGTGHTEITAVFGSIVATLNLLFSVLLTLHYGIFGTAASVLITQIQAPIFIWYVTRRVVRVPTRAYFERVFAFHIIPAIIFSLVSLAALRVVESIDFRSSLLVLSVGGTLCTLYYSALLEFRVVSLNGLG